MSFWQLKYSLLRNAIFFASSISNRTQICINKEDWRDSLWVEIALFFLWTANQKRINNLLLETRQVNINYLQSKILKMAIITKELTLGNENHHSIATHRILISCEISFPTAFMLLPISWGHLMEFYAGINKDSQFQRVLQLTNFA